MAYVLGICDEHEGVRVLFQSTECFRDCGVYRRFRAGCRLLLTVVVMVSVLARAAMTAVLTHEEQDFEAYVRIWQRRIFSTFAQHWTYGTPDFNRVENLFDVLELQANEVPWLLRRWLPLTAESACGTYLVLRLRRRACLQMRWSFREVFRVESPMIGLLNEVRTLSRYFQGIIFANAWLENWWRWRRDFVTDSESSIEEEEWVPLHEAR